MTEREKEKKKCKSCSEYEYGFCNRKGIEAGEASYCEKWNGEEPEQITVKKQDKKFIGYVQLYFKVVGKSNVYYASFHGNFGKPLSWLRLWIIKQSMKRAYQTFDTVYSVDFCTKDEFEASLPVNGISFKWGGAGK